MCMVWFIFTSTHSLCWVTLCTKVAVTTALCYSKTLLLPISWDLAAPSGDCNRSPAASWNFETCVHSMPTTSKLHSCITALLMFCVTVGTVLPVTVICYATARIFCVILRTHRQIAAQIYLIAGHIDLGNIRSLTFKSIRSGRNVMII